MDCLGDQFLTATGLADDEHGRIVPGHAGDHRHQLAHDFAANYGLGPVH